MNGRWLKLQITQLFANTRSVVANLWHTCHSGLLVSLKAQKVHHHCTRWFTKYFPTIISFGLNNLWRYQIFAKPTRTSCELWYSDSVFFPEPGSSLITYSVHHAKSLHAGLLRIGLESYSQAQRISPSSLQLSLDPETPCSVSNLLYTYSVVFRYLTIHNPSSLEVYSWNF